MNLACGMNVESGNLDQGPLNDGRAILFFPTMFHVERLGNPFVARSLQFRELACGRHFCCKLVHSVLPERGERPQRKRTPEWNGRYVPRGTFRLDAIHASEPQGKASISDSRHKRVSRQIGVDRLGSSIRLDEIQIILAGTSQVEHRSLFLIPLTERDCKRGILAGRLALRM